MKSECNISYKTLTSWLIIMAFAGVGYYVKSVDSRMTNIENDVSIIKAAVVKPVENVDNQRVFTQIN